MKDKITTTKSGFRVEDVTFHNARKQSAILDELEYEDVQDTEVVAPKSLTPEQVTKYYEDLLSVTSDLDSKRVYSQTIKWIKELQEVKAELSKLRQKELKVMRNEETPDDIEEDDEDV